MLKGGACMVYESKRWGSHEIDVFVSGGVASGKNMGSLQSMGVPAVILGKSINEGKILLSEISRFVAKNQSYVG